MPRLRVLRERKIWQRLLSLLNEWYLPIFAKIFHTGVCGIMAKIEQFVKFMSKLIIQRWYHSDKKIIMPSFVSFSSSKHKVLYCPSFLSSLGVEGRLQMVVKLSKWSPILKICNVFELVTYQSCRHRTGFTAANAPIPDLFPMHHACLRYRGTVSYGSSFFFFTGLIL